MRKDVRTVCFDEDLSLEAVSFEGVAQPFPNHFHDYYVIGLVKLGERKMQYNSRAVPISGGDILLLNPKDSHGCVQTDDSAFDYIALNISESTMRKLAEEITGESELPRFSESVVRHTGLSALIERLYELIFDDCREFEKEETLLLLMSEIFGNYGQPFLKTVAPNSTDVERVCAFLDEHYSEHLRLSELCRVGRMSKSTLLRSFAKFKGITPYRYLQSVRINRAKELLEKGASPADTAVRTGFSDQSHFTNSFHTFLGLSPAVYSKIFEKEG